MKIAKITKALVRLYPAFVAAVQEFIEARDPDSDGGKTITKEEKGEIVSAFFNRLPDTW